MNISLICVGKIKEEFLRQAASEYLKRLSRFANVQIVEVKDERTGEDLSGREAEIIKEKEAERILKVLKNDTYVITLEINGSSLSSAELADRINNLIVNGVSSISFIIGGSLGLHESVTKKADLHLSFSSFTFPHQLMRVILLEQIYRSFKIINGEPYHK